MINTSTRLKKLKRNITSLRQPIIINEEHSFYGKRLVDLSDNEIFYIKNVLKIDTIIDLIREARIKNIDTKLTIDKKRVLSFPMFLDANNEGQLNIKYIHQPDFLNSSHAELDRLILSSGVGTGKTLMSILWFYYKATNNKSTINDKIIIFTKKNIMGSWKNEWKRIFLNSKLENSFTVVEGSSNQKIEKLEDNNTIAYCINYESLLNDDIINTILSKGFRFCIFDESHNLKNIKSKITHNALFELSSCIPYVLLLSGTVFAQRESDIFSQLAIVDRGLSFGGNFTSFKNKYFNAIVKNMKGRQFIEYTSIRDELKDTFSKLIEKYMYIVPEIHFADGVFKKYHVELTNKEIDAYISMYKNSIIEITNIKNEMQNRDSSIDTEKAIATIALTKMLKLRQVTSGFVNYIDIDGNVITGNIGTSKCDSIIDVTKQILNGELESVLDYKDDQGKIGVLTSNVCIVCNFKFEIEILEKALQKNKIKYGVICGGLKVANIQNDIAKFKNREINVMILQSRAAGEGINDLQQTCNHMLFFSNSHSRKDRIQVCGRINRSGQTQKECYFYDFVSNIKDEINVDIQILDYIENKSEVIKNILTDISNINFKNVEDEDDLDIDDGF